MDLTGTVDVPGMGNVKKKWILAGVAVTAGIVAWSYYRKRQNTPVIIDEEVDGSTVPVGDSGYGNRPGQTGNSNYDGADDDVIDTVAEWTAEVQEKLGAAGFDAGFIALTIGKWIAGDVLTDPEQQLIKAAVASAGQPPGGPYPIKTALPGTNPPPPPGTNQPPALQSPWYVSVSLDTDIGNWIAGLNAQHPGLNLTWEKFASMNQLNDGQQHRKYWRWVGSSRQFYKWHATHGIPPLRIN